MTNHMAGDGADSKAAFRQLGAGALALGAMTALGYKRAQAKSATKAAITDADVLNFALNLEYLEAEYYLRATTGSGLPASLTSGANQGTVTTYADTLVPFQTPAIAGWALRIANDERSHVNFLREGIAAEGGTPVGEPNLDLMTSFNTLAVAAGLITQGQTFNPFASEVAFLIGAYIFEDVGVTAYAGAASLLTNPDNIAYGASVLAIEAEHAGCVRAYLAGAGGGSVTNAISALRQKLSGVTDHGTDQTLGGTQSGNPFSFANNDYNGQVYRRTPEQVLNVVYGTGAAGATKGLFFPTGMNGAVATT